MSLQRPVEPAVLAEARRRLVRDADPGASGDPLAPASVGSVLQHPDVVEALMAMTGDTCAYCERGLQATGADAVVVAHHRPTWGAVGLGGEVDPEAYRWLALDWDNLVPACADCVRLRGTRFPVAGPRAGSPEELAGEEPLVLDPVADDPDEHLRYQPDGTVAAFTRRGKVTNDILALNRDALVRARADLLTRVGDDPELGDPSFPSVRRQLRPTPSREARASLAVGPALPPTSGAASGSRAYDLTGGMADEQREGYFQTTRWIERVVITNFRPIRDVDLDLSRSTSDRGPWTVLLGENGSGKSSVLHAVALTLMGGEQRRALGLDPRAYLRHGARKGLVQVYLAGRTDPLELRWGTGDTEFDGPEAVPALLLGYGATRLLPRGSAPAGDERVVRVDNLFDPLHPLTDPTTWLLGLDEDTFVEVAHGIHRLLALGQDDELVRDRGAVHLRQGRSRSDVRALSDGYQSMVVMSCDILRSVLTMWAQPTVAEGIVLLDEIGAHLHPRWRMRVVPALRELLPRVQFLVTTHDPLCLRGVLDGEVVVVRRNSEGEVVTITDLPPVTGMRIDQLLTSEHFGLGSTDDPEVADLWEAYYRLKAVTRPSREQQAELRRVRARLDELEQLGTTERDRLLLESADQFIAERRESGDAVPETSADVAARLSQLWTAHLPGPDG